MPSCCSTWCSFSRSPRSRTLCLAASRRSGHCRRRCCSWRLVGVGLHFLDHQLAQSRNDAGTAAAVPADARRAGALDLDPEGVRIAGIVVRRSPTRRCRSARPYSCGYRRRRREAMARMNAIRITGLAVGVGGILDRGRLCRGASGWRCGPWRWRSNTSRRRCGSGSRNTARLRWRTGSSRAAIWPSAAPASSSSRSANPSS